MAKIKAPFLKSPVNTTNIMADVLIALIPVSIMAIVKFGYRSAIMIAAGIISAVLFEYLYEKMTGKDSTIKDLSAAVTGLLVALSYPANVPIWIIFLGTFIAIVVIKQFSGGIGKNIFNPAVISRVLIKILFTPIITNWIAPGPDAVSIATPLEFVGNGQKTIIEGAPMIEDLFFGNIGGGIGETVKWAILIGLAYLVIRKIIHIEMPLALILGLFLSSMLFGESDLNFALYHILSGTALFAAVFMATDYSTSPLNRRARFYYALAIGILTGIIRQLFDLPGGIGISILLMNLAVPLFETRIVPRVFGHREKSVISQAR